MTHSEAKTNRMLFFHSDDEEHHKPLRTKNPSEVASSQVEKVEKAGKQPSTKIPVKGMKGSLISTAISQLYLPDEYRGINGTIRDGGDKASVKITGLKEKSGHILNIDASLPKVDSFKSGVKAYINRIISDAKDKVSKELALTMPNAKIVPNNSSAMDKLQMPKYDNVENGSSVDAGSSAVNIHNDEELVKLSSPMDPQQKTDFQRVTNNDDRHGDILNLEEPSQKKGFNIKDVRSYVENIVIQAKERFLTEENKAIIMPTVEMKPTLNSAFESLKMPKDAYEEKDNTITAGTGSSSLNRATDGNPGKIPSLKEPKQEAYIDIKSVQSYIGGIITKAQNIVRKESEIADAIPTAKIFPNISSTVENLQKPYDVEVENANDASFGSTAVANDVKKEVYIDLKSVQSYIGGIITKAKNIVRKESEIADAIPTAKIFPNISSAVENLQKPYDVEVENVNDASFGSTAVANDVNHGNIASPNDSSQKTDFHMRNGSNSQLGNTLNQRKSDSTPDFNRKDVKMYIDHVIIQAKQRFVKENEMAIAMSSAKISPDLSSSVCSLKASTDIHVESSKTNAAKFNPSPVDDVSDRKTDYLPVLKKSDFDLSDVRAYVQNVIHLAKNSVIKEEETAVANKFPSINPTVVDVQISRDTRKTIDTGFELSVYNIDDLGTRGKIANPPKIDFHMTTVNESQHDTFQNARASVLKTDVSIKDVKSYIGHVVLQAKKQVMKEKIMTIAATTTGKTENHNPTPVMNKANLNRYLTSGTENNSSFKHFACNDKQDVIIENRFGSTSVNSDNDGERGNIFTPRQPTQEKHIQMKDVRSYVQQVIIQAQNKLIRENNKPTPMSFTEKDETFGHSTVFNDIMQPQTGGLPKNVPKENDNAIGTNVGSSSVKSDDTGKPENILAASFESSTENTCTSQKPGNIESHKDPSKKTDFKSKDVKSYVAEIINQAQQKLIKENSTTTGMSDTESIKKVRESVVFTDKLQAQVGTFEGSGTDIEACDKHKFGNVANISSGRNTSNTEKLRMDINKVVCYIKQLLTDDQKMAIYEYCRNNATGPDGGNRSDFTAWIQLEQNTFKGNKTPIENGIGSITESIQSCIQQIIDDAKRKIFSGNRMAMEISKMGTKGTIESSFDAKLKNPIDNDIGKPVWRRSSAGDTGEMHWNNCDYLTLDSDEEVPCAERVCTNVENQITEDNKLICRLSGEGDRISLKSMGSNKNIKNSLYAETLSQHENIDKKSAKSIPMKIMKNVEAFHDGDRCTDEMPGLDSPSMATSQCVDDNDIVNDKAIQLSGRNGSVGKLKLEKCTAEDDIAAGARISSDDSIKDKHAISNPKMYITTSLELKDGIPHSKTEEQILSCMENLLVEVERITTKGNEVKHNYSAMTPTSSSTYMLNDVKENKSPISARTLNVFPSLDGEENESSKCIDTVIALSRIDDETSEKPSCLEESRFNDNSTTETLCQQVKRFVPCIMDKNKDKISPSGSGKRIAVPKTATLPILPCKTKTSIDDKRISKPLKLSDKGALSTLTRLPSKPTIMRTSVVTKVKPTETASVRQKEGKEKMQTDKVGKLTETLPNPGEHVDRKHAKWKNRSQCKVNKIGEIVRLKENMKGQYQSQKRPVPVRKSAAMSVVQAMLMEKTENHVQSGVTDDQFVTSSEKGRLSDYIFPKPCSTDIHSDNQEIEKQIEPWEPTDQKTFKKGRIKSTFSPPPENDRSKCQKTCSTDKIEEKPLMPKLRMRQNGKGVKQYSQNTERNEAKLESIGKYTDPESANSLSVVSESVSEKIPLESQQDSNPPKSQPNLTIICNDNQGTGAQTECQESTDEKELPNSSIFLYDGQFISAIFIEGKRKRPSKSISNRRTKDSEQQTEHQECTVLTGQKQGNGSIVNPETISHIPQNCEGSTVIQPKILASETNNLEQQTEHQERTVLTDQKQDNGRIVNPETISHIHQKSKSPTVIESKKLASETNISDQQIEHQELTALSNQDQGNGKIVIRETVSLIPQISESSTEMEPRKHASETNKPGVSSEENVKDRKTETTQQKKQIKIKSSEIGPGKAVPSKGPLPPIRNRIAKDVKGEVTPNRKLRIIVDNSIQNRPPWNASPKLRLEWEEARLNRHKKINTGGDESKLDDILHASKFSKCKPLPDIIKLDGSIKTKTGRLNDIMSKDRESENNNTVQKLSVLPSINTGDQNKELTGDTKIIRKVARIPNNSDISGAKTNVLRRKAHGLSTSPFSHEIKYTGQDNEFGNRMEVGGSTGTNKNENNRRESRYIVPVSSLSYFSDTVHSVSENTISSESNILLKTSMDVPSPRISSASLVSAVTQDSRNRSHHVY